MQKEFIDKLQENIKSGKKKILLVSATGSGKTYAAALGCKKIEAKRVLFVMDKQKVLEDSMGTFMNIMPEKKATDFPFYAEEKNSILQLTIFFQHHI